MSEKYQLEFKQLYLFAEEPSIYILITSDKEEYLKIYTKETLIEALKQIRNMGWIPNARKGNVGGIGNTIEDLLGIEENNLPIPNAAEWELKCKRAKSSALTTLFHMEPSPRALRFVPRLLLPKYGWKHKQAGKKYEINEMSFRQTIHGKLRSSRGFIVQVNHKQKKVLISFDASTVHPDHQDWLESVHQRTGLAELNPQPYWGFDNLNHKVGTKLLNCFYLQAQVKKENNQEFYHYSEIMMLQGFNFNEFLTGIEEGFVYIDFDARTNHNHGTKFRLRQNWFPELYSQITII